MSFVQRYLSCLSLPWFSLGSYIALMTAMSLKEKHKMEPLNFFVSSAYAPHQKKGKKQGCIPCFLSVKSEGEKTGMLKMKLRIAFSHYSFDTPLEALLSQDIRCLFGSEDMVKDIKAFSEIIPGHKSSAVIGYAICY
ncbi:hypothetical protein LEMLEM_LOCUS7993 [Lemmus lemmus]